MSANPLTTIPVHADVVRQLQKLKTANQTWDQFLLEMAEDYVPPWWFEEMERRRHTGRDFSGPTIIRRSRALARRGQ